MMSPTNSRLASIEAWLKLPSNASPLDEIDQLRGHLLALAEQHAPHSEELRLVEGLHVRTQASIESLLPRLYSVKLPVSHATRQTVRAMQESLDLLARLSLGLVEAPDSQLAKGTGTPLETTLWRIFHAIGRHICLSDLTASPCSPGIWLSLHRTYLAARRHQLTDKIPTGAPHDLQSFYARILLLGALPASALNAQEWSVVHRLAGKLPISLKVLDSPPETGSGTLLWVAPELDMAPVHFARKPPADDLLAIFVQYHNLLDEISRHVGLFSNEPVPPGLLPPDVSPRIATIALKRIREYLDSPKKRRFPRRRQGYRVSLCFGIDDMVRLLAEQGAVPIDLSKWMIVNESPGGYAAMHVAGRPHKVQVGDLIGMCREGETSWSACVVRWALSENQEHLELGLQEISPSMALGKMASPGLSSANPHRALFLPAFPPLRTVDAIAFSPENRPACRQKHLLIIEDKRTEVREFSLAEAIEQSADAEVFLIDQGEAL